MFLIKGISPYSKAEKLTHDVTEELDFMEKLEAAGFTLSIQKINVSSHEEYAMSLFDTWLEMINSTKH